MNLALCSILDLYFVCYKIVFYLKVVAVKKWSQKFYSAQFKFSLISEVQTVFGMQRIAPRGDGVCSSMMLKLYDGIVC